MYKVIGILKRPEGMSRAAFHEWWLQEHAPKVKKWPGLKRYAINLCTGDDQPYDGVAEVWFETKEALERVFSTPEGQVARESATGNSSEIVILLTREHVIVDG